MAVNGKQKGNRFERDIANMLSSRFEEHTGKTQSFRRNADSGSFWGGKNKERKETHDTDYAVYGDLICPKTFKFTVECKNYKTPPSMMSFISQDIKEWDKWISQAEQDATECDKDYILVMKYNRVDIFCILDGKFEEKVAKKMIGRYYSNILVRLDALLELETEFFF